MTEYQWNPTEQEKIDNAVGECVQSLERQENESNFQKDVADRMKEELSIKPALFNALVKERFDQKSTKNVQKHEDIVALNEMLVNNCKKS